MSELVVNFEDRFSRVSALILFVNKNHATKCLNFISSLIIILVSANEFSCHYYYCLDYREKGKRVLFRLEKKFC